MSKVIDRVLSQEEHDAFTAGTLTDHAIQAEFIHKLESHAVIVRDPNGEQLFRVGLDPEQMSAEDLYEEPATETSPEVSPDLDAG